MSKNQLLEYCYLFVMLMLLLLLMMMIVVVDDDIGLSPYS